MNRESRFVLTVFAKTVVTQHGDDIHVVKGDPSEEISDLIRARGWERAVAFVA